MKHFIQNLVKIYWLISQLWKKHYVFLLSHVCIKIKVVGEVDLFIVVLAKYWKTAENRGPSAID